MFDISSFIQAAGYLGVFAVLFTETGLLVGLVLPGDSLLFTAGFLASQGFLNIAVLCMVTFFGAVIGDKTGYWLGRTFGPRVFTRERSLFFRPAYITEAQKFIARYGVKAIVLARFVPVVRTIAPTLAGVGRMRYSTFLAFSMLGGLLWAAGIPLGGYWLGASIPGVDRYLLPIVLAIIVLSVSPGAYHFLRQTENRRIIAARIRSLFVR